MPDTSVLDKLREAFKVEPPEPPPAGMTFEQRAALIGTLFALREPGQISLGVWAMQLRQALNFSKATKPLAEAIPLDEVPEAPAGSVGTKAEKRRELLSAIARAGLRLAEMHPIAAFGGDARQILAERVDEAVARSKPFLLGRWLLPAVIALILGGTVWGVISVRGLKADLRETQQAMDAMRNEVTTAAKQAEVEITNKSNETQTKLANLMKNELQQALKDTEDNITQTKTQVANAKDEAIMQFANWRAEAAPRVNTELKGISDWGTVQKKQVSDMADKERGEVAALLPTVEKAKADAKPTVDAELRGISDWGTVQKKQVSDMADKERGEIAALLPIVEKAKADAKPTVDAELKGISDWGTVQKKQVSDMADKERGEIAALLPIVEKAKADAKPTVDAELKGVSDWGTVQKKQVSDMADRERSELDQDKQSVIGMMQQRQREVQDEADRAKTQLSGLLINVRQGEDDLEKRLLAAEIRMKKLDDQMVGLRATVQQASQLQSVLEQTDRTSTLNLATLIRVLEWKDLMAIAAILLAALAVVLAIASFIRNLWRRPPEEVGPANRAAA